MQDLSPKLIDFPEFTTLSLFTCNYSETSVFCFLCSSAKIPRWGEWIKIVAHYVFLCSFRALEKKCEYNLNKNVRKLKFVVSWWERLLNISVLPFLLSQIYVFWRSWTNIILYIGQKITQCCECGYQYLHRDLWT